MEKVWCYKTPSSMNDETKNEILEKVFDTCIENDDCEDIGEKIIDYLTSKKHLYQEKLEDNIWR